jgi:glycosyltransferase involved in cell wall biosynthesis
MPDIVFSIVTVVRNAKTDLEKTLNSIRQQTYPHIELIVIDGASIDGTLDCIKNNLDRISAWRSEPDTGIYDAMNKGKNLATGDFVTFINAGDTFYTTTVLEDIYKGMDADKKKLYYGKVTIFNKDVEWEYKPYDNHNNDYYLPHHQSAFYPAIFYQKEDYDTRFKIMGDVDFTLRATKQLEKHYIPVTTIRSEMNGFSVMVYRHWRGIRLYIKDHQLFTVKYPAMYMPFDNLKIYSKAIVKYVAFKIGGSYLINKMIAQRLKMTGSRYEAQSK